METEENTSDFSIENLKLVAEYGKQAVTIQGLLLKYFGGDSYPDGNLESARYNTWEWMTSKNPLLGNLTPHDMIYAGRFEKLHKFVTTMLEENENEQPL